MNNFFMNIFDNLGIYAQDIIWFRRDGSRILERGRGNPDINYYTVSILK